MLVKKLNIKFMALQKEKYLLENRSFIEQFNFSYTRQREMTGLDHFIFSGGNLANDEAFGVILADDFF